MNLHEDIARDEPRAHLLQRAIRLPRASPRRRSPRRPCHDAERSPRARSRPSSWPPLEVGSRSRRDQPRLEMPPRAVATYTSVRSTPRAYPDSARNRPERPIHRRARRQAAHRHQTPLCAPGRSKADFRRLWARCHEAVSGKQSGPTGRSAPTYIMHMLGLGQWARQWLQHAKRCQS